MATTNFIYTGRILYGKHNFLDWRRDLERIVKQRELIEVFKGKEKVPGNEPSEDDYLVYYDEGITAPVTRSTTTATMAAGGKDEKKQQRVVDGGRSFLHWKAAHDRWIKSREKFRLSKELIMQSVSPLIAFDIEDDTNPLVMYNKLEAKYGASLEVTRANILKGITTLKLQNCSSMTEYLTRHRELKKDFHRVGGGIYDDFLLATNIIAGLPACYEEFKKAWEWSRAGKTGVPDITFLYDRLVAEEKVQNQICTPFEGHSR